MRGRIRGGEGGAEMRRKLFTLVAALSAMLAATFIAWPMAGG
jgi:hypothetical protein